MSHDLRCRRKQYKVVAGAQTFEEFHERISTYRPELTVVTTDLKGELYRGLDVHQDLRAPCSPTQPTVLVDRSEPEVTVNVFARGSRYVICLREQIVALCNFISTMNAGRAWAGRNQLHWIIETLVEGEPIYVLNRKLMNLLTWMQV